LLNLQFPDADDSTKWGHIVELQLTLTGEAVVLPCTMDSVVAYGCYGCCRAIASDVLKYGARVYVGRLLKDDGVVVSHDCVGLTWHMRVTCPCSHCFLLLMPSHHERTVRT
jgi:hypothetical protein